MKVWIIECSDYDSHDIECVCISAEAADRAFAKLMKKIDEDCARSLIAAIAKPEEIKKYWTHHKDEELTDYWMGVAKARKERYFINEYEVVE